MKYCANLYTHLEIRADGSCWMCCPAWLPHQIGNVNEHEILHLWNGSTAHKLRNQIFTEQWEYCNSTVCPKIVTDSLPHISTVDTDRLLDKNTKHAIKNHSVVAGLPTVINFSEDESCNLRCPSCRTGKILYNRDSKEYKIRKQINDRIFELFFTEPTDRSFSINVTGSGDPFASVIYRSMLERIDGNMFPNLTVNLNTNGVMFTPKNWDKLYKIHDNLGNCRISLDAGTKYTYENVTRLGGTWDTLVENCKFLNERTKEYSKFNIHFDFVVQADNYKEMKQYIEFIKDNFDNATAISFSKIIDWKTWSVDKFESKCIWLETHPEHNEFLQLLKDPIFDSNKVYLNNLLPYRQV